MKHTEVWTRLPDLLEDRDDAALLAHVRGCADCQRQLFLLGRVDRLLHNNAPAREAKRMRRLIGRRTLAVAAAAAATAAAVIVVFVPQRGHTAALTFRTASGHAVGQARMVHSDTRNFSLALSARELPVDHGQVFVLWADDRQGARMEVGHFMVNRRGACRVRFNLPETHAWQRFWITRPSKPAPIVAST